MDHRDNWLKWAVELQSLSQSALAYCKDPFDMERFHRIREISAEMVAQHTDLPMEKVKDLFCGETGYQTPKLDCRIIAVQDWAKRNHPGPAAHSICKIFVLCALMGGEFQKNNETTASSWFSLDDLPALAEEKTNRDQIKMCFLANAAQHWETVFD